MTVRVTREAEPQIEIYGGHTGELLGGAEGTLAHTTFTPTGDYVLLVRKNSLNSPQLEAGNVPTSYIPTDGATATRAADVIYVPAANIPAYTTALSMALEGEMSYADEGLPTQSTFVYWAKDSNHEIRHALQTYLTDTGQPVFIQDNSSQKEVYGAADAYSPGVYVPFSIAARHGSTFINGAVDGVALTEDSTPTALADLSAADLYLAYLSGPMLLFNFRFWAADIGDTGIAEASA
jgi:hypothetical protein